MVQGGGPPASEAGYQVSASPTTWGWWARANVLLLYMYLNQFVLLHTQVSAANNIYILSVYESVAQGKTKIELSHIVDNFRA